MMKRIGLSAAPMARISLAAGTPAAAAAPAGGAWKQGRGCTLLLAISLSIGILGLPLAVWAEPIDVPSGMVLEHFDTIEDTETAQRALRYRFVAPEIAKGVEFSQAAPDMEFLCNAFALPDAEKTGSLPERIVISLMSEPTEFGVANPEVTQFFESYTLENGVCIWEIF